MKLFETLEETRHEQVVFSYLNDAGLKAIIAIHDTTLGPALGGCRMYPYASEEDAIIDVLRLSKGMTYKAAAAGLNLGGGKAVIIGDPKKHKSENLFRAFGRAVNALGGRYITAEDVGTDVFDMEYISQETDYVTGIDVTRGGSGDPSPFTAWGVLQGMKASLDKVYGTQSFEGKTVAVQGLGNVGSNLVKLLLDEGAKLFVADVDAPRVNKIKELSPGIEAVSVDDILQVECDVLAPCALGGVINDKSIETLRTRIVCGAANNQLAEDRHGKELANRGILYAPDFVVNAGGLINVYVELEGYSRPRAYRLIRGIFHNTRRIFQLADADDSLSTAEAANQVAVERMHAASRLNSTFRPFPNSGRRNNNVIPQIVEDAHAAAGPPQQPGKDDGAPWFEAPER